MKHVYQTYYMTQPLTEAKDIKAHLKAPKRTGGDSKPSQHNMLGYNHNSPKKY